MSEDKINELADEYYNAMKMYYHLAAHGSSMSMRDWIFARRNNWNAAKKAFDELNEMGEADRAISPLTRRQDEDGNWVKWDGSKWVPAYPPSGFGQQYLR
tara:strand:- start:597 stop:896 length:300 start_codon:yes stop_codon:yes gene_type:complete